MMKLNRYLTAIGLTLLLALPAVAQTASSSKSPSSAAVIKLAQARQLVDINAASAEELDKLPGIGPARAKAIIANRPYHGKDDLTQRKIIPPNVYNQIKDKIIARQK
jgi:competence ComEA-like helix-hairpin-helix protein